MPWSAPLSMCAPRLYLLQVIVILNSRSPYAIGVPPTPSGSAYTRIPYVGGGGRHRAGPMGRGEGNRADINFELGPELRGYLAYRTTSPLARGPRMIYNNGSKRSFIQYK